MLMLFGPSGVAQQLAQYSQYLDNYFLINTAATNLQNNMQLSMGYRRHWTGFQGSPNSFYLTAYAPLTKPSPSQYMQASMRLRNQMNAARLKTQEKPKSNHVVGAILTQDDIGIFSKNTVHLTYSFHLPVSKSISISFSPKVGWMHLSLNDELTVLEANDLPFQEFLMTHERQGMADLGFGLWLYSDKFFVGYSMEQLVRNNALNNQSLSGFEFEPHHFGMMGFRLKVNTYLRIVPHALVRYVDQHLFNVDYSMRFEYGTRLWASISYRKENAVVGLIGMAISRQLAFNYSFDHSNNIQELNRVNAHEISLRFSLFPNLHR